MQEKTENIVLEHLKAIRKDLYDLKEGQRLTNERLSGIEHHQAGFHVNINNQSEEIEALKTRLEQVEKRLDLHDPKNL